jgi:hypothetical protein
MPVGNASTVVIALPTEALSASHHQAMIYLSERL